MSALGDRPPGSPLALGEVVAGKYRIEREIGRGGMGIVFAATHLALDRLIAIKVMKHELLQDEQALQRLLLEARAAAKIQSEHVARVLDVETLPSGIPYIVMEYLDGQDLGALIDRNGALSVQQSVTFILQACEALSEVHVHELVHRDLKPGNLFIAKRADGSPAMKVVDFGISKDLGKPGAKDGKTTSPHVLGSPFYMAPEQMRADAVDARSDIWALGAILFEMLTARTPFTGETLPEVYAAVLGEPPPPVNELEPTVPAALDRIVQRCLEKEPVLRFANVAELARELAPFGGVGSEVSVERIRRVLSQETRAEDAELLGESVDVPTSQVGTPGGYVQMAEEALAEDRELEEEESLAVRAPDVNAVALAVTYPPDDSSHEGDYEESLRLALAEEGRTGGASGDNSIAKTRDSQVGKTAALVRSGESKFLLPAGAAVVAMLTVGLLLRFTAEPESDSSDASNLEQTMKPERQVGTLLLEPPPPATKPEESQAAIGKVGPKDNVNIASRGATALTRNAAESTHSGVAIVSAKQAESQGRTAPESANESAEIEKRRKNSAPKSKSRSTRRKVRAGNTRTELQSRPTAEARTGDAETGAESKSQQPSQQPSRPTRSKSKKDYWNSDSFGDRR